MPTTRQVELKPRKVPVQARSTASVEAICEATIQVLLHVGKEKLTTTRVAHRAGVSVGTPYQYFPNKSSLLQAVLRAHLDQVYAVITRVCDESIGKPLPEMADALVHAFLAAKLRHEPTSRALYLIADDVGGAEIARNNATRGARKIAAMLETAPEKLRTDAQTIALTLMAAMAGVSRRMLEAERSAKSEALRHELTILVRAYLTCCAG